MFSQLITLFSRQRFYELLFKHGFERYSKGYSSRDHFVAMLFCQLAQAKSLREICGRLACCIGRLRHLGMKDAPNKSTLSYANAHRPWQMYRDLFYDTLKWCRLARPGKHKFRFRNKLLALDSTTISLCLSLFPWAKFRRAKGAIKLHLLLDHDGYLQYCWSSSFSLNPNSPSRCLIWWCSFDGIYFLTGTYGIGSTAHLMYCRSSQGLSNIRYHLP